MCGSNRRRRYEATRRIDQERLSTVEAVSVLNRPIQRAAGRGLPALPIGSASRLVVGRGTPCAPFLAAALDNRQASDQNHDRNYG